MAVISVLGSVAGDLKGRKSVFLFSVRHTLWVLLAVTRFYLASEEKRFYINVLRQTSPHLEQ